jgi:NAD-dependent dihydropyrimidine dehydrogenase PreA subunit
VATLEFYPEHCTGCRRCIEVCPHAVFRLKDKGVVIGDRDMCMECGACENNCAFGAVKVAAGVGCASAIINSMITGGEPSCGCSESDHGGCC